MKNIVYTKSKPTSREVALVSNSIWGKKKQAFSFLWIALQISASLSRLFSSLFLQGKNTSHAWNSVQVLLPEANLSFLANI
jgi:hypothetical protein